MITRLLHGLMAQPKIYDLVQTLVGAKHLRRRLQEQTRQLPPDAVVLDLGGGTGLASDLWPSTTRYICLDIDPLKLTGFLTNHPGGIALLADASRTPIADQSLDAVLCTNVSHHLDDALLPRAIREAARILKPTGRFIFLDAVWKPARLPGRLIWRFDRGSFPRRPDQLSTLIAQRLEIVHSERIAIYHEYLLCVASPKKVPTSH